MGIVKDGSVFHLSLEGSSKPETRISFAVNNHAMMVRPRIDCGESTLRLLLVDAMAHVDGARFVDDENWSPVFRKEAVRNVTRFVEEMIRAFMASVDAQARIPIELVGLISSLAAALKIPLLPLTIERIVDKLTELSEEGTRAVCLECESRRDLPLKLFTDNHSEYIATLARQLHPFFGVKGHGYFGMGSRGFFWVPPSILKEIGMYPAESLCVNFPLAQV